MYENRLLIMEDEQSIRTFIERVAEGAGFAARHANGLDEFLVQLETWKPTVIILDLNMPDTDGVECMRRIRETYSKVKILIMSGMDNKTLESVGALGTEFGLDVVGTLQKPVSVAVLRKALENSYDDSTTIDSANLSDAIERDALFLLYQPKIDLNTNRVVGVEALVRWRAGEDVILPEAFIPLAEDECLIDPVSAWVIKNGIRQQSVWLAQGTDLKLSINISAKNLHNLSMPDEVALLCYEADVPPQSVILELTETAAMGDRATLLDILTRFRIKGFELSIDDFGTGYSSLVQLQRLPFSELKIDREIIADIGWSSSSAMIAKSMIAMGKSMDLVVTAEGIENADAVDALKTFGCDLGQGFYYSYPIGADDVPTFVKSFGCAKIGK